MPGTRFARRLSIGLVVMAVAACSTTIVDVSDRADAATEYVPGAIYVTLNDRYLDSRQGWPAGRVPPVIVASPHSYGYPDAPRTTSDYLANPGHWPKILGIVPAGTRIRLKQVEHHKYPGLDDWFEAYGVIETGEFRGREVDLSWISSGVPDSRMLRVNPQELSLATAPAQVPPRP